MRGIAILVAMVVSGCSLATPGEVFRVESGELGFTDAEMAEMQTEADRLCELTDGGYCPELTRGPAANVVLKTRDGIWESTGRTTVDKGKASIRIVIRPELPTGYQSSVWRHELGHAGGCLEHLGAGNMMASRTVDRPQEWTTADLSCIDRTY